MKLNSFLLKKWGIRALTAIGAALGLSSCFHSKNGPTYNGIEAVYGPPEEFNNKPKVEIIEDVYGPPVELDTVPEADAAPIDTLEQAAPVPED